MKPTRIDPSRCEPERAAGGAQQRGPALAGGAAALGLGPVAPAVAERHSQRQRDAGGAEAARRHGDRHAHADEVVRRLDDLDQRHDHRRLDGEVVEVPGGGVVDGWQPPVRALGREEAAREADADRDGRDRDGQRRAERFQQRRQVEEGDEAAERQHGADRHRRGRQHDPQRPDRLEEPRRLGAGIAAAQPHGEAPGRVVEQGDQRQKGAERDPAPERQPAIGGLGPVAGQRGDTAEVVRRFRGDRAPKAGAEQARGAREEVMGEQRAAASDDRLAELRGLDGQHPGAFLRGVEVVEEFLLIGPLVGDRLGLRGAALVVGFGAELRQPVLHGRDAGRELRRDRVHLARDRVHLAAHCCSTASPSPPRASRPSAASSVCLAWSISPTVRSGACASAGRASRQRTSVRQDRKRCKERVSRGDGSVERRQAQARLEWPDRDGAVGEGDG